jgi:hypothetical protein
MVDATTESVPVDISQARERYKQATKHAQSAGKCVDSESTFILLYTAVHKALTGALLAAGLRISSGERGHKALIEAAKAQLGAEHAQLLTRIDRARRKRNSVAYETDTISKAELDAMKTDTIKTLQAVNSFITQAANPSRGTSP